MLGWFQDENEEFVAYFKIFQMCNLMQCKIIVYAEESWRNPLTVFGARADV